VVDVWAHCVGACDYRRAGCLEGWGLPGCCCGGYGADWRSVLVQK
jgi:hypothetical protein